MTINTIVSKFQLGQDPKREEAGQRIAYFHFMGIKRRRLEREINKAQAKKRHGRWMSSDEANLTQLEKALEQAVIEWKWACSKWSRTINEHRRLYKGEPRMILTLEQKQYFEESLELPELSPVYDLIKPVLRDAIVIGVSRADEVLERPEYEEGFSSHSMYR